MTINYELKMMIITIIIERKALNNFIMTINNDRNDNTHNESRN